MSHSLETTILRVRICSDVARIRNMHSLLSSCQVYAVWRVFFHSHIHSRLSLSYLFITVILDISQCIGSSIRITRNKSLNPADFCNSSFWMVQHTISAQLGKLTKILIERITMSIYLDAEHLRRYWLVAFVWHRLQQDTIENIFLIGNRLARNFSISFKN